MAEHIDTQNNDEIDLLELLQTVWQGRKTIIKWTLIFALIGLFIAIFSPKEYTANTVMVPQTSDTKVGGNLGGLAAMAGINLGAGNAEGFPPNLYPKVVNSIPFKRAMLDTKITIDGLDQDITLSEYLDNHQKFNLIKSIKKYTVGLPGLIIKSIKSKPNKEYLLEQTNDSIIRVSDEEYDNMETLSSKISTYINDKEGYISLSVAMPEPLASAQLTKKAQQLLQKSIIEFKVNKAKEQLEFIENRYNEAKKDFIDKQSAKASFQDRNRGISTALFGTRLERLQADYNLAYEVSSELAKQMESQRIKVKEGTPVFTIIEPVSVPVEKSKPKRATILIIWSFIGLFIGAGIVLGKDWIKKYNKNNEQ